MQQDVNRDGTNEVDALSGLVSLANAITNWENAITGSRRADVLSVFLIGEADETHQTFRLNETESLKVEELRGWLDAFTTTNVAVKVNVIMDFAGAGRFVQGLAASNRVCIASCKANESAVFKPEGAVSFSRYFLTGIFNGHNLAKAFDNSVDAIGRATKYKQSALLPSGDKKLALERYIGMAFMTGAEAPTIGRVTPVGYWREPMPCGCGHRM